MIHTIRKVLVVLTLLATLAINWLANAIPLGGNTTAEVSDRLQTLITPANYVFAIWGAIYVGLTVYAVYQLLPDVDKKRSVNAASWWFIVSNIANSIWILLWHYDYIGLTILAMTTVLVSLSMIYRILRAGKSDSRELWFAKIPFSVYLGWITIATIANVSAYLVSIGWDRWGLSEATWAMIMLAVATLITVCIVVRHKDLTYGLVIVWALLGILANQSIMTNLYYMIIVLLVTISLALIVTGGRIVRRN